jgi:hypothetical protein
MAEDNEPAHISALPSGEVPAEDSPTPQVPSRPHMPPVVIAFLEARLKETSCFLEYGAGGSTLLAASLNVPQIVSVETDARFAQAVRKAATRLRSKSVLHLITIKLGRTKEWGVPATFDAYELWPEYALRPWEFLRKNELSPDLILIDGRFRVASFFASLLEARPGTLIMFDDYLLRKGEYDSAESVIAPTRLIGRTAVFTVPDAIPLRKVARALARHVTHPL